MDSKDNNNLPQQPEVTQQASTPEAAQQATTPEAPQQPEVQQTPNQPDEPQAVFEMPQGIPKDIPQDVSQDISKNSNRTEAPKQRTVVIGQPKSGQTANGKPKKKMAAWKKGLLILGIIIVCVVLLTVGCSSMVGKVKTEIFGEKTDPTEVATDFGYDYIGTLFVEGEIDEYGTGTYNHQYLLNAIDTMMYDPENQGMILYVETPGGSVYASDELYLKIREYQEVTGRPVYSSMQSQATSGGYYISASADKILANRNCWTGSIGVTMGTFMDVSGLLENLGIKTETITSGENKAMGSGYEEMTAEQREIFQSLVDEAYDQFVGLVAEGREMDEAQVRKLADGRIYTAKQALENGLIDGIATYEEAIDDMKKTYELESCEVEEFYPEASEDIYSLLGILAEQKNMSGATDAELIEELMAMNGTFTVSYLSEIRK